MIDHTTLPHVSKNVTVIAGQRFRVVGRGFDLWPSEIVLGYNEDAVINDTLPTYRLMRLVSKNDTELIFEATATQEYTIEHTWTYFAGGDDVPRTLLQYV